MTTKRLTSKHVQEYRFSPGRATKAIPANRVARESPGMQWSVLRDASLGGERGSMRRHGLFATPRKAANVYWPPRVGVEKLAEDAVVLAGIAVVLSSLWFIGV